MKNINYFIAICSLMIFMSCGGDKTSPSSGKSMSGEIRIDGSSTVYPITEAIAEEFRNEAPRVKVTIGISGTGGGFKKFGRGETDISDASRPIKDSEAQACQENGIEFMQLSVAFDGLAVVVNPENTWVESLTVQELKTIWEPEAQDKITNWNKIRIGFPDQRLSLMGPGTASGTFDYFTEAIVGKSGSSRGDFMPSEDDHVLVQGVAGDKGALGFFGLAYFLENQDKLKLIAVDNGTAVVKPNEETVKTGEYSPLSRPIFIYVSSASVKKPEVVSFINFYLDNATELVPDVGYIPLPDADYARQKAEFAQFVAKHGK
jgi:phosphate transport system substrate-binding protein